MDEGTFGGTAHRAQSKSDFDFAQSTDEGAFDRTSSLSEVEGSSLSEVEG